MKRRKYRITELVAVGVAIILSAAGVAIRQLHGASDLATIFTAGGVLLFMVLQYIYNLEIEQAHKSDVLHGDVMERQLLRENQELRSEIRDLRAKGGT